MAAVGRSGPLWTALGRSGPLWAALGNSRPLWAAGATASRWGTLGFLGPLWPLRGGGFGESGVRIRARSTYTNTSTTEFHELPSNGLGPLLCYTYLGFNLSFWSMLGVLGNWGRLCPFDMIFSANGSVFRAEHDPLLRTSYFLSKTRVLRVRKRCSTLQLKAR